MRRRPGHVRPIVMSAHLPASDIDPHQTPDRQPAVHADYPGSPSPAPGQIDRRGGATPVQDAQAGPHRLGLWPAGTPPPPPQGYEDDKPGALVYRDIKKLGRIPDGGGHRKLGRQQGRRNRSGVGYSYLHHAVVDHSRLVYSEILCAEKGETSPATTSARRLSSNPGEL